MPRASGILLHPTSLPSRYGVGDLGTEAYHFIDFLAETDQQYWQILPLGPTGYGNSPYMCYSAMAGNPIIISPDQLVVEKLLTVDDVANVPQFAGEKVEFDRVLPYKTYLLKKAFTNFQSGASTQQKQAWEKFIKKHSIWLNDYALFMAIKTVTDYQSWHQWEPELRDRKPAALKEWENKLTEEISYQKFIQFEFFRQWEYIKTYANEKGISIIGDIPIYVAHDSADVWANPELFCLDKETGEVELMAGVPPDYFSETGQLWGNPIYNWEKMAAQNFSWWVTRFECLLELVDVIRVDHFRGFDAYWAVPQGETTAMNGEWVDGPGAIFFETMQEKLGQLPIIAEDLGVITPTVEALRDGFNFPGMKILQFAFGGARDNPYLPFALTRNCVVYTGTHDNDTTVGWFDQAPEHEREYLLSYLGSQSGDGIHWDLIRLALSSVADLAVIPLQDILGLDTKSRMNTPGTSTDNWAWRYWGNELQEYQKERLKKLTNIYGRIVIDNDQLIIDNDQLTIDN